MVISLGMYDGVHRGHERIIYALKSIAEKKNYSSGIFSFWSHPRRIINPEYELKLLTNIEEKIEIYDIKNKISEKDWIFFFCKNLMKILKI